jgi:hypothetical protein
MSLNAIVDMFSSEISNSVIAEQRKLGLPIVQP